MGIEFSSGIDNTLKLSPSKNKYTFDLKLRRYRASKFHYTTLNLTTGQTKLLKRKFLFHLPHGPDICQRNGSPLLRLLECAA